MWVGGTASSSPARRTGARPLPPEPPGCRTLRLDAALVPGDPRRGIGLAGKRADGRRIAVRDADFDAEVAARPRDDPVARLGVWMSPCHRRNMVLSVRNRHRDRR